MDPYMLGSYVRCSFLILCPCQAAVMLHVLRSGCLTCMPGVCHGLQALR